jgi:hypothetical protein
VAEVHHRQLGGDHQRGVRALLSLAAGALGVDAQHGLERRGQQRGDLGPTLLVDCERAATDMGLGVVGAAVAPDSC